MIIPTQSFEVINDEYQQALNWMTKLGINISPGRTQHYAKIIDYWKNNYKLVSEQESKDSFPEFVSSIFEIYDFIEIYKSLLSEPPATLTLIAKKLQKGANGPTNSVEETSKSTTARNYIFEGLVAARCHVPSHSVKAILDAKTDTGIIIENKKIWVECKRITSLSKLEANVRDACNQIEKVLKSKVGSGHRGMVAIDFTKILHDGDKLLVKDDDRSLQNAIHDVMDLFIKQYSNQWQKVYKSKNKKIIGTILRFSTMATSENRNLLVRVSEWGINPRIGIENADNATLRNLTTALNSK